MATCWLLTVWALHLRYIQMGTGGHVLQCLTGERFTLTIVVAADYSLDFFKGLIRHKLS